MSRRVRLLNGRFDPLTQAQTVDAVFAMISERVRGWLCTVNVSTLMAMRADPWLQTFVDRAALVVADGQPLVWSAPLFGGRLPERVAGIDLIDDLCGRAEATGTGVYLLGSTSTALAMAMSNLRGRYPGLRLDGADGYFAAADAPVRADEIRASGAGLLLVGMGSPRQDEFIFQQWERLGAIVAIGVGGSFDVLAGLRWRAPRWVRHAGMEWAIRLVQEPRRLLPRYLSSNTLFCALIARQLFSGRTRRAESD